MVVLLGQDSQPELEAKIGFKHRKGKVSRPPLLTWRGVSFIIYPFDMPVGLHNIVINQRLRHSKAPSCTIKSRQALRCRFFWGLSRVASVLH